MQCCSLEIRSYLLSTTTPGPCPVQDSLGAGPTPSATLQILMLGVEHLVGQCPCMQDMHTSESRQTARLQCVYITALLLARVSRSSQIAF